MGFKYYVKSLHLSLREAFLEILPYYILSSIGVLIANLFEISPDTDKPILGLLIYISSIFQYVFPVLLVVSISYHLAKNLHLHRLSSIILSILIFVTICAKYEDGIFKLKQNIALYAFLIPILSLYFFMILKKVSFFNIIQENIVSEQLKKVINSIIPIFITYIVFCIGLTILEEFLYNFLSDFVFSNLKDLPLIAKGVVQIITTEIIWWSTGIHGYHIYKIFTDTSYTLLEIFDNVKLGVLLDNFVFTGGTGATLSLVLATIFTSKNAENKKIAYISLPFAFFNINEILLFGLPIIINTNFIIPFLLTPLFNFVSSCIFFSFVAVPQTHQALTWTMPTIMSGYLLGGGESWAFALLQLFNLIVGVFIYLPFMRKNDKSRSFYADIKAMKEKFGIKQEAERIQEKTFIKSQSDIVYEQSQTQKTINDLLKGDLLLYYQPKIDMEKNRCYGFEALLRFKDKNGKILGPYFIPQIEKAGYSHVIDLWVIEKVCEDLKLWHKQGFYPHISINLSPESISNQFVIKTVIEKLKNKNISVEILERSFANEINSFIKNIIDLKNNNFIISLDDFGTGYSSLKYLYNVPIDIIKLDKGLIDNAKERSGKILYANIVKMCKDLNFKAISEGVERKEDIDFIKSIHVDMVQGYFYSPAISFDKVKDFSDNFPNLKI